MSKVLLAQKTKNLIQAKADELGVPVSFVKLKNILINGDKRGCSGFVMNEDTASCVYLTTESSVYGPLSGKILYRYAATPTDYSSTGIANGNNRYCLPSELADQVLHLLTSGKTIQK